MPSGNVAIEAIAYELPPHRVTSAALEERIAGTMERLGMAPGRLEALTGIRERRFWDPGMEPGEAATLAARKVLDMTGIDPKKIGCLINTSVSRSYVEPSIACSIHDNLKLSPHCQNYDVANACLGFVNGMNNIVLMIEAGLIDYGLVVDGETAGPGVEATIGRLQAPDVTVETFRDNFATLTLGSGAVAMLLCRKDLSRTGHVINGSVSLAATQYNKLCIGRMDYMRTDTRALLIAGVELACATWKLACETLENWSDETMSLYAPHQVSLRHTAAVCEKAGITMEKLHLNLYTNGNMGPVAMPASLAMADEAGRLKAGDHVGLLGIGSGLNCTMMSVTW
jgi:3-oxoacyl-[acyl-carrier-protein] synthase III